MAFWCERRLIGEILVERGLITKTQLEEALLVQQRSSSSKFIGEILMVLGYASEMDVVTALVLQCNLPYIAMSRYDVNPDVVALVPEGLARQRCLVPFERIGHILSVAMQNPCDAETNRQLQNITGCKIAIFISTKAEIESAINKLYGAK